MKKEIEQEIRKLSPGFPKRKSKTKESLPNGYFDDLQERVLTKVATEGSHQHSNRISINRFILGIAAVFMIGICGWIIVHLSQRTEVKEMSLELSKADAFAYALEYPLEMEFIIEEMEESVDVTSLFSQGEHDAMDSNMLDVLLEQMTQSDLEDLL